MRIFNRNTVKSNPNMRIPVQEDSLSALIDKRVNKRIAQSVKQLATVQTLTRYHDVVSCSRLFNRKTERTYFQTGDIVRCVKTGKFVSLKEVYQG